MNDFYRTSIPDEDVPPEHTKTVPQETETTEATIGQRSLKTLPQPTVKQSSVKIPLILVIICGLTIAATLLLIL